LPDLESIKQRRAKLQEDLQKEEDRLAGLRERQGQVSADRDKAANTTNDLQQSVRAIERTRDSRQDAWYSARRLLDDVGRLGTTLRAIDDTAVRIQKLDAKLDANRERAAALRDAKAKVIQKASRFFAAIVRDLVGPTAHGRIALDGNGLHLIIEMGGERSTAAIDSLKILAFDLAGLCMSIEEATHVPAFLLHDSPREADLGLSAYHRLFHFARSLEEIGGQPLFQYIVTTTTRPPDDLLKEPWLRLTLEGAPAEKRLLRKDL
jgi:hypothetical protein